MSYTEDYVPAIHGENALPDQKRREELRARTNRLENGADACCLPASELRALLAALDRRTALLERASAATGDREWKLRAEINAELEQDQ